MRTSISCPVFRRRYRSIRPSGASRWQKSTALIPRSMNLADMQKYRPDDIDTVKATNAYSFDFDIAVDAAKAAMASFAASQAME